MPANRRMLSNRIVNSAKFLQMPNESQLLYFHLVLKADDDGVVESYPVIRLLGLPPDNLKVLVAKDFIKRLNAEEVIVITNWLEHNKIRADRKIDSIYKPLLNEIYPEIFTITAKARSDVTDNSKRTLDGRTVDALREDRLVEERREGISSFEKEKKKKPFFEGQAMREQPKGSGKLFVIPADGGSWLEFAGLKSDIEWK